MRSLSFALLMMLPLAALAQSALPTEFPEGAEALPADVLQQRIAGKVLKGAPADGISWRLDYKSNGYVFLDTGRGFRDSGKWRIEGSQMCVEWKTAPGGCSETRVKGNVVYLKRNSTGEVVALAIN